MLVPHSHLTDPHRNLTLCPHQSLCGGCACLDIAYPTQAQIKAETLSTFLASHNPDWAPLIHPMILAPQSQFHRNKMEFSFGTDTDQNCVLGLKERGKFNHVIPLSTCLLQDPTTPLILHTTTAFFNQHHTTAWNPKTHQGMLRNLVIRHSKTTHEFMVILVVSAPLNDTLQQKWVQLITQKFPQITSLWVGIQDSKGDTAFTTNLHLLAGKDHLIETLDSLTFRLSPASFFQTNTEQAKVLYRTIAKYAALTKDDQVFDLYCGTGTIGLYLAPQCGSVIGIDNNPSSIENAHQNARDNGISNITFKTENTKNFLKFTHEKATKIVIDPPRDGLVPKAIKRIMDHGANTLVYVSCNPNTLARDLTILTESRYHLTQIQPVDMFPNTWHLETVCQLTLK